MKKLQTAFGAYLEGWHTQLVPTTPALTEYAARPFATSVASSPGRMVDAASEMVAAGENTGRSGTGSDRRGRKESNDAHHRYRVHRVDPAVQRPHGNRAERRPWRRYARQSEWISEGPNHPHGGSGQRYAGRATR